MPRNTPRRPLFGARVDPEDMSWAQDAATDQGVSFSVFARRIIQFARLNMPAGWQPPPDR